MRRRVNTEHAAEFIGGRLSPRTMERWRVSGVGPPFIKLPNGDVLYDIEDIAGWLAALRRTSTSDDSTGSASTASAELRT